VVVDRDGDGGRTYISHNWHCSIERAREAFFFGLTFGLPV
jgi:hypothetical protein